MITTLEALFHFQRNKSQLEQDGFINSNLTQMVLLSVIKQGQQFINTQTFGVYYKETFSSVAKMNIVRVLLYIVVNCGWSIYQIDVKNAFMHGDIEKDVYMRLPPGYPREIDDGIPCKLCKALYGLKQSHQAQYSKLDYVILILVFKRSYAHSSLFVRNSKAENLVMLVYVDNLIIIGDNMDEIMSPKSALHNTFAIKDLCTLKYFLGIEMDHSSHGLFLNQ